MQFKYLLSNVAISQMYKIDKINTNILWLFLWFKVDLFHHSNK